MRRHDLDVLSLGFGVLFLAVCLTYLLTHTTGLRLHWLVVIPAVLIAAGGTTLALAGRRAFAQQRDPDNDGL